jgi:metallopeptidase MepB
LAASSAIVANFARGTATTPALLPSTVSKRLFHELGHAMHAALSRARCARQHLVVGRYAAYTEAVSMLFEQFLWTPEHTRECSLHYSHVGDEYARAWRAAHPEAKELPPRQLPAETVSALLARRAGASAIGMRSRVFLSRWDLAAYGPASREELADVDLAAAYNRMRTEVTGFAGVEIETGRFDFGHGFANLRLIAGIYAAYYYCYAFSRVWALDMFYTGFKGDTMNKEKGRRYRQIVLERSDSMAPMDILREFLGREPSDEALFDASGL